MLVEKTTLHVTLCLQPIAESLIEAVIIWHFYLLNWNGVETTPSTVCDRVGMVGSPWKLLWLTKYKFVSPPKKAKLLSQRAFIYLVCNMVRCLPLLCDKEQRSRWGKLNFTRFDRVCFDGKERTISYCLSAPSKKPLRQSSSSKYGHLHIISPTIALPQVM